jgi:hypothetical protein
VKKRRRFFKLQEFRPIADLFAFDSALALLTPWMVSVTVRWVGLFFGAAVPAVAFLRTRTACCVGSWIWSFTNLCQEAVFFLCSIALSANLFSGTQHHNGAKARRKWFASERTKRIEHGREVLLSAHKASLVADEAFVHHRTLQA